MNHDAIEELLALRIYGETSSEEDKDIDRHLMGCGQCRKLAAELDTSLGSLPRRPTLLDVKPHFLWLPPARLAAAAALLGFLAGSMFAGASASTPSSDLGQASASSRAWADLPPGQTPPLVTSGGRLSRLGSYLRR